jgi:four helix bundle protein
MDLVLELYRCTKEFPRDETFCRTSQMRRAVVSIPSNIAEGKGRHSPKELTQFLLHARGSLLELETQCTIAQRLGYLGATDVVELTSRASEVGHLLNGLIAHFREP